MATDLALSEQEQISILAHKIYIEEGCPEGCADEHWARAERAIHEQRLSPVKTSKKETSAKVSKVMPKAKPKTKKVLSKV